MDQMGGGMSRMDRMGGRMSRVDQMESGVSSMDQMESGMGPMGRTLAGRTSDSYYGKPSFSSKGNGMGFRSGGMDSWGPATNYPRTNISARVGQHRF